MKLTKEDGKISRHLPFKQNLAMKISTRIMVLIASLALIVSYFVPMWDIDLDAPQYPEGLGMKIWTHKISGDLNTINGLNPVSYTHLTLPTIYSV